METTVIVSHAQQKHSSLENDHEDIEGQLPATTQTKPQDIKVYDLSHRAQWLRAAVLGANDGLLSTASLMMGVGAVRKDIKTMLLTGIAGLVAGACSMAIGEFVSVYSQYDIENSQIQREIKSGGSGNDVGSIGSKMIEGKKKNLPSPIQAAVASAVAFGLGALVPLVAAAFIRDYHVRLGVVIVAVSLALIGFGWLSAVLGRTPVVKSTVRVLVGGLMAMGITFGLTKAIGSTAL